MDGRLPAGGFLLDQTVELYGEAAPGCTSLELRAVALANREERLYAWVDGPREFFPAAAAAAGVDLQRLLIAWPPAPEQRAWATVKLARSGAFACVVLDLTRGLAAPGRPSRLPLPEVRKLADAAERGGRLMLLLIMSEAPRGRAPAPSDGLARLGGQFR